MIFVIFIYVHILIFFKNHFIRGGKFSYKILLDILLLGVDLAQIMEYQGLLGAQALADVLPPPQDLFGLVLHGTLVLSSRSCYALISTGAPRTLIRPTYARGVGFYSVPRLGGLAQRPDGSWFRATEHYHPSLHMSIAGLLWRVRAVEDDTGPFDLILGADWLHGHHGIVDIFARTVSLEAPAGLGRMVMQFVGQPPVLEVVDVIPPPPAIPAAPAVPVVDLEEEPEEQVEEDVAGAAQHIVDEPVGNGFIMNGEDGVVTDDDSA